jgi:GntR family transcriptional repressor for pyruvate dehydrogenase complex
MDKQINSLTTPVQQGSVVLHVIERIKEALLNKELRPGDYLPSETELAKSLGVGKTSIREAVKMLQALGIVEVKRGQGTIIRKTPGDEFINSIIFQFVVQDGDPNDIIHLRMMFEPAYTVMAMQTATEEDVENLKAIHQHLEKSIKEGTQTAEEDMAFHRAILQCTHNPFVIWIGEAILQIFRTTMRRSMTLNPKATLDHHKHILEAFCQRDEQKLRETLAVSFEQWNEPVNEANGNHKNT